MYERFTDRARKVMQLANQEARRLDHKSVGTGHILLGVVKEDSNRTGTSCDRPGVAARVLTGLGVDLGVLGHEVERVLRVGGDGHNEVLGRQPQTPQVRKAIEYAIDEAGSLGHKRVGTEHLLLGLLRDQEGVAAQVLMNFALKLDIVREEVRTSFTGSP